MVEILAIRDNETGLVPELREVPETEDVAKLFVARREKFPPPRYDLVLGMAESMDAFLTNYPRFRRGGGGGADGSGTHQDPGAGQDPGAAGTQHGDGARPR
jgi:hypothetical protein